MATPWTTLIEYPLGVAQLASAVTNSATGAGALPLKTGHGTQFSGAVFPIVVTVELEHIICSAIVGDALTVTTRGAYSTTARAHLANATVKSNIMAVHLTEMRTAINAVEDKTQKLNSSGDFASAVNVLSTAMVYGGAGVSLRIGSDTANSGTVTNATNKNGKLGTPHYTNAEEPVGVIFGASTSSNNTVAFGGGSALLNAATILQFYTAENTTTTAGTLRMDISSTGLVRMYGDAQIDGDITLGAGSDITLNTTTGTRIGMSANGKLGFWGATAVTQPTAVANATDAASVISRLNDLLSRLRIVGLIAT